MFKEALRELKDLPLDSFASSLFVDRESQLLRMEQYLEYYEGQIVGIAGERGIGKTTLLNLFNPEGFEKIFINVIDRESKLGILADILYGIMEYAKIKRMKRAEEKAQKALSFLIKESVSVGFSYVVSYTREKEREKRYSNAIELLKDAVSEVAKRERVVVILDELDKEKKEDILLVVDSIKYAFEHNTASLFIALPEVFYREFVSSSYQGSTSHNLENVFSEMLLVPKFSDENLRRILEKRFPLKYIDEEALSLALLYADGNPRRLIRVVKEAGLLALDRGKIGKRDVSAVVRKYLIPYIQHAFSEKERQVLRVLEEGERGKITAKIAKSLRKSRSLIYKYLDKFHEKGLVDYRDGEVVLRKRCLLFKEFL